MSVLSRPIYYKNSQWAVTSYGVECRGQFYAIKKKDLWQGHPDWSWEEQLAEKNWVRLSEFRAAMQFAYNKFKDLKPPSTGG